MSRERLPDRRPSETFDLEFEGVRYAICLGRYPADDRIGEIFSAGAKIGSSMDALLDDVSIALSLLLQHQVPPAQIARSMGRVTGKAPASIVGALADLLGERQAAEQGTCGEAEGDT